MRVCACAGVMHSFFEVVEIFKSQHYSDTEEAGYLLKM